MNKLTLAAVLCVFCINPSLSQYFQTPFTSDATIKVSSLNAMATSASDIGYDYNIVDTRLVLPLVKSIGHDFPLMKFYKHNELTKFIYSQPVQTVLNIGYTHSRYQLLRHEQNFILSIGFQGYQYRRLHSFLVYRFDYFRISRYEDNHDLHLFTGYIGYLKQMGASKSFEIGLFPVVHKEKQAFIPYVALRVISGRKFQSYIHLPTEIRITYMYRPKLFFSLRGSLNANPGLTSGYYRERQVIAPFLYTSLHSGLQVKWKISNTFIFQFESGLEFKNDLVYPTIFKSEEKVKERPYLNFSLAFTPGGHANMHKAFDYK